MRARVLQWFGLVALVGLALVGVALAQTSRGHSALRKAGLMGHPAPFTELSFLWPNKLPEYLIVGRSAHVVPFIIHNSQGRRLTYRWEVTEVADRRRRLASGAKSIASGDRTAVAPRIGITCPRVGRIRVLISLPDQHETIDWWVHCLPLSNVTGGRK